MKKLLKYTAWTAVAIVVLALGAWLWAYQVAMGRYEKQWSVHAADFQIPFPLTEDELGALRQDTIAPCDMRYAATVRPHRCPRRSI